MTTSSITKKNLTNYQKALETILSAQTITSETTLDGLAFQFMIAMTENLLKIQQKSKGFFLNPYTKHIKKSFVLNSENAQKDMAKAVFTLMDTLLSMQGDLEYISELDRAKRIDGVFNKHAKKFALTGGLGLIAVAVVCFVYHIHLTMLLTIVIGYIALMLAAAALITPYSRAAEKTVALDKLIQAIIADDGTYSASVNLSIEESHQKGGRIFCIKQQAERQKLHKLFFDQPTHYKADVQQAYDLDTKPSLSSRFTSRL